MLKKQNTSIRTVLTAVLCALLTVFVGGCTESNDPASPLPPSRPTARGPRPKNLILISIDTVRADHLGSYGYDRPTTPRLDAYAETGALFLNCTSPSSWTVPAHLSIFTGLEPATHGCVYYPEPGRLNDNFDTMAKIFTRGGFRTAAFTGGGYCGDRHGIDIGFEHFESRGNRFEHNLPGVLDWLDRTDDEPFFLFFHGFNAHRTYAPPPPYYTQFAEGYTGKYDILQFKPNQPIPSPADLKYVVSQYDGEIAFIDTLLDTFFTRLSQRGLLEDTLVIITSDHGDEFYEHDNCDHIHTLYDELVQVPWIMFGPSVPAIKVQEQVGTIDILPTVLAMFDLQTDSPLQGTDRSGLLAGESVQAETPVYTFTGMRQRFSPSKRAGPRRQPAAPLSPQDGPIPPPRGHASRAGVPTYHFSAIRTKKWKLITTLPAGGPNLKCAACTTGHKDGDFAWLFDLEADPREQQSVAQAHPDVVRKLRAQLEQRLEESRQLRQTAEKSAPPSEEYLRSIRALGYTAGGEDEDEQSDSDATTDSPSADPQ